MKFISILMVVDVVALLEYIFALADLTSILSLSFTAPDTGHSLTISMYTTVCEYVPIGMCIYIYM